MRMLGLGLTLCAVWLVGCGDKDARQSSKGDVVLAPAIALEGVGWDGQEGFDPTEKSEKVRAIAFFRPGCLGCQNEAKRLVELQMGHADLEILGATRADTDALFAFRKVTGADYPILHGVSDETFQAYGIAYVPQLVVLSGEGAVVGRGIEALEAAFQR